MKKTLFLVAIFITLNSFGQIQLKETDKLAITSKIWGFLKYYHPEIGKGKINWDEQLFKILPKIKNAKNKQELSITYLNWINSLCNLDEVKSIAIDGKTIRGASTKSNPNSINPHILTAWASEQGISLGQLRVDEKSNEITAIPELIKKIVVKGSVITIDAMGCQKKIVNEIIDQKADYLIAVKANQKTLEQAIKDTISLEKPDIAPTSKPRARAAIIK